MYQKFEDKIHKDLYMINNNKLYFMKHFNEPLINLEFPDNITHIIFNDFFNSKIIKVKFPNTL